MSKGYPINFRIHIPEPVEVKMVSLTIAQRDAIHFLERYKGLFTYVVEDDTFYYLSGGTTNNHWKPINTPQVIEIYDSFSGEQQKVMSGYAIKEYLENNYVSKQELELALKDLEPEPLPPHIKNITEEDIYNWNNNKGDKHKFYIIDPPQRVWLIRHEMGVKPSVQTFTSNGDRIFGREKHIDNYTIEVSFTTDIGGYITFN